MEFRPSREDTHESSMFHPLSLPDLRIREISWLFVISEKNLAYAELKGTLGLKASWFISAGY
jgi:hypothetical protein